MIISASYKTDIPTFYGEWFMNRLKAGYCKVKNPYNDTIFKVDLTKEKVDGFIFWTKNIGPFMNKLETIKEMGFPFIIQHTVTGYPKELERSVVDHKKACEYIKKVSELYGPRCVVWRYDTILNTTITTRKFHVNMFKSLAETLSGSTDEVVISYAHLYKKTLKNLEEAAKEDNIQWRDPDEDWKLHLSSELASIAKDNGMMLNVCSQPNFVSSGCGEARCIDAKRLSDVAGYDINAKLGGPRKTCGCYESKDIGEYDTCPHGCIYCYAVQNQELAKQRYKQHDPTSETLFPINV